MDSSDPSYQLFNPDPTMMQFGNTGSSAPQSQNPSLSTPPTVSAGNQPTTGGGYTTPGSYSTPSNWQQILSGVTGGQSWQTALGQALPYGIGAGVGLLTAKGAQNQASSEAGAITAASQPFLNASQQFLKQFQGQTLTPQQQQYVDWTSTQAQDLVNSGTAAKAIATTNFADYQAGTLKPADQIALDQQTQAQKQQIASMLSTSGIQDSSILAGYNQQIDNQAAVTRQNVLNSYFQTGESAYNTWLNSTAEGIQVKTLGAQFAQNAFQEMLQASLGFGALGMRGLETAIGLQIQSDQALSSEVGNLMQNLMASWALQNGLKASGAAGKTTLGGAQNLMQTLLGDSAPASVANFNNAFMSSGVGTASTDISGQVSNDFSANVSSQLASEMTPAGSVTVGAPGATDVGGDLGQVASNAQSTSNAAVDAYSASYGDAGTAADAAGGTSALGIAGGALGTAGGIYDLSQNWSSGATGSDVRGGAETGAGIGAFFGPEGALIGAGLGAAAGAVSSLFGPGKKDPETQTWDNYASTFAKSGGQGVSGATPAQNFQMLAGIFDARGSQLPFYQKYGRMGENAFMKDMATQIDTAVKSGKVPKNASPQQIYSSVVEPWINSMSPGGWQNTSTSKGAPEKPAIANLLTSIIQQYQSGDMSQFTGIAGQASPITQAYGG